MEEKMNNDNQKVNIIENYIEECTDAINKRNIERAKQLQKELLGVYNSEIKYMTSQLSNYSIAGGNVDFINDLIILRAILLNHKANIVENERLRNYELEKLKLQQAITTITNQNSNQNSYNASTNVSSENTINVAFEQALKNITNLDNILNENEKDELEGKISALKIATESKDKTKIINKIGSVIKFVAEKGIEIGIAVLPYLGEISKLISTM
jgi:hypothetical protein